MNKSAMMDSQKTKIRNTVWPVVVFAIALAEVVALGSHPQNFIATFQWVVQDSSPDLVKRGQKIVVDEFRQVFHQVPEVHRREFETRLVGNEVVLTVATQQEKRSEIETALGQWINHLNGRVHARGRATYLKASEEQPAERMLRVFSDEDHTQLIYVAAQLIPLRELLKEIKAQVKNVSYLIPGECADKPVDWSFGDDPFSPAKSVDEAFSEVAVLFGLKLEKRNGSFIFTGTCDDSTHQQKHRRNPNARPNQNTEDLLPSHFKLWQNRPSGIPAPTRVYFPVTPLSD